MPEIKSQPMTGLCAMCCAEVVTSKEFAVRTQGDEFHELPPWTQCQVLQDMASGEWEVGDIRVESGGVSEVWPMAAVAMVGGTATCAMHLMYVVKVSGLWRSLTREAPVD